MIGIDGIFRRFPDFKGKRRLARIFFRNSIANRRDIQVKSADGCIYNLPNLKETLALDVFINGIYEEGTHKFLVKRIPENGVFLDLGANIGTISVPLCRKRPDIKCIAVEASPWVFDFLSRNVKDNLKEAQIDCVNKALFDTDNKELSFFSQENHFGKGSLSPVYTRQGQTVNTITVDSLLQQRGITHVDMIKIDIEGYEYFAFKGAEKLLKGNQAPDILFEFIDWAEENAKLPKGSAQAVLSDFGYNIYELSESGKIKSPVKQLIKGSAMLLATKKPV